MTARMPHHAPHHPVGASRGGSAHENQDRWGVSADGAIAWVLDGVTRVDEAQMGLPVAAFVAAADAAVSRAAAQHQRAPLPVLLRAALADLAEQPEARYGHRATLALGRRDADGVDWLLLCDARVLGAASADDPPSDPHDLLIREANGVALRSDQRLRRSRAFNVAGGYWIIDGVSVEAADHALTGRIDGMAPVILMSDGPADGLAAPPAPSAPSAARSGVAPMAVPAGFWAQPAEMYADLVATAEAGTIHERLENLWPFLMARDGRVDDLTAVVL